MKWLTPDSNNPPEGNLLVQVDWLKYKGDSRYENNSDTAIVYVGDNEQTLHEPEYGDVWAAWEWVDVSRYVVLDDLTKHLGAE